VFLKNICFLIHHFWFLTLSFPENSRFQESWTTAHSSVHCNAP